MTTSRTIDAGPLVTECEGLRRRVAALETERLASEARQRQQLEALAAAHQALVDEAAKREDTSRDLAKRIKELGCLYRLSGLTGATDCTAESLLQGAVALLTEAIQYPELASTRISFEGRTYASAGPQHTGLLLSVALMVHGVEVGRVEVGYPGDDPSRTFLDEERALLDAVAEQLGKAIQRLRGEEWFRKLIESSSDAVAVIDATGRLRYRSPNADRVAGQAMSPEIGESAFGAVHPDDVDPLREALGAAVADQSPQARPLSFRAIRRDGTVWWVEGSATNLLADPAVRGIVVSYRDATEKRRAEAALRDEQERLGAILETVGDPLFVKDDEHRIILANRAFHEIFGLDQDAAIGKTLAETVPPDERQQFLAVDRGVLDTGVPDVREESLTVSGRTVRTIVTRKVRFIDNEGKKFLVGSIHDITERKRAETEREALQAQLFQAQKMEAVGQLAGGIAHDFNNILGAIILQLNLLQVGPTTTPSALEAAIGELLVAAKRASGLTRQLLLYSRRQEMTMAHLEANALIRELTRMLERMLGEQVAVSLKLSGEPQWIDGDPGMIEQVVANLCVNARDAMPMGGRITLATSSVVLDDEAARRRGGVCAGRFVCLQVSDTGSGIDPAVRDHIFEPFFSTKPRGMGSGLGLATVHGIVGRHGGFVEVESQVGLGTTFNVYLPSVAPSGDDQEQRVAVALRGGGEAVLVVEDEASVRRMTVSCLRQLGYRVTEARNGVEALAEWDRAGGQFDLLLTDMVMPEGLSGLDLCSALRKNKAGLRAIVTSGYNTEIGDAESLVRYQVCYLPKPFDISTLAALVRECLER